MTTQPEFTIAELGAKFGAQLAQIFSELITAEKIIESQQMHIQALIKNETALTNSIQKLKSENLELRQALEQQQGGQIIDHGDSS